MSWTEPGMVTSTGAFLTLSNSDVHIEIDEMIATITTTHTYTNNENTNIEAVYTFPVPQEAVLLSMIATVGDKTNRGYIIEKARATRRYEDAIAEGDSAVLVEHTESGIQTMSVGNIMAGESATVTVTYALVLRWNGDQVRLQLPTTISPRYGAPPKSRPAHHEPAISIVATNTMRPNVVVRGILSTAEIACLTHQLNVRFDPNNNCVIASSDGPIYMDRDLVLNFISQSTQRSWAIAAPDGDRTVVLAGLTARIPPRGQHRLPKNLMIVIDCSGSMNGNSIKSARAAVLGVLGQCLPGDQVNVLRFGTEIDLFSKTPINVGYTDLTRLKRWCARMDADLGGTDAYGALSKALHMIDRGSLLFITDGEVNGWVDVVSLAKNKNVPVFCVGIGSAPNMSFVEQLARQTGGACEFVTPNEDIVNAVRRHSVRILEARSEKIIHPFTRQVVDTWIDLKDDVVFDGDTVLMTGRYVNAPTMMELLATDEYPIASAPVTHLESRDLKRIAASLRLPSLNFSDASETAVHYQLMSPFTSCVMVAERADLEKADTLPVLATVQQMLSAGWGGTSSVTKQRAPIMFARKIEDDQPILQRDFSLRAPTTKFVSDRRSCSVRKPIDESARSVAPQEPTPPPVASTPRPLRDVYITLIEKHGAQLLAVLEREPQRLRARKLEYFLDGFELVELRREAQWANTERRVDRAIIITILQLLLDQYRAEMSAFLAHQIIASIAPKASY